LGGGGGGRCPSIKIEAIFIENSAIQSSYAMCDKKIPKTI